MLRRMVNLVSGQGGRAGAPATEMPASQFADIEKAELKAMIERKRRNDFIRKRELDMLRRIRREGLGAEEDSPLAASSHLDDSEIRPTRAPSGPDRGVKAKIDAIEKQMVGLSTTNAARISRLPPVSTHVPLGSAGQARDEHPSIPPTQPMSNSQMQTLPMDMGQGVTQEMPLGRAPSAPAAPVPAPPLRPPTLSQAVPAPAMQAPRSPAVARPPAAAPAPVPAPSPAVVAAPNRLLLNTDDAFTVEVSEVAQDHEMDEAVIAFANADFAHCERIITQLVSRNGVRHKHPDTWLALFDFYRATGQSERFESLTTEFVQLFQRSGPQWFSIPKLVAEATAAAPSRQSGASVGWICPRWLTSDAVTQLSSQALQLPQPWVMDWSELQRIEPDAAERLRQLLAQWAGEPVKLRWTEPERLLSVLGEATPTGMRDVDPAYWMVRLETLRLINRPDQFDEVAIDYCVTYEVSPPSWEPARCDLALGGGSVSTESAELSVLGDVVTTMEGVSEEDDRAVTSLELSGQLAGDLANLLDTLDHRLGSSTVIHISCALLIRVDFIAAGDLLNWVIAKRAENRHIKFIEVHRLVALMFGAMGINDHAPVQLRQA